MTANKTLVALNSGAFFALINFWGKSGGPQALSELIFHPAYLFALGLTAILIFALVDYINGVFFEFENKCLFWACLGLSMSSGTFFLTGAWLIAYALSLDITSAASPEN